MLPTRLQISPTDGENLDERTALEHFLGKSRSEAARMFCSDVNLLYLEDLVHMGIEAFRFYFPTVESHLRDESNVDDEVFAGGLLYVVENRLQHEEWRTAAEEIGAVLAALDDMRAKFALDERSLRDLRARVAGSA